MLVEDFFLLFPFPMFLCLPTHSHEFTSRHGRNSEGCSGTATARRSPRHSRSLCPRSRRCAPRSGRESGLGCVPKCSNGERRNEVFSSFQAIGVGFDSHRPLHKSRGFGCLYAAESLKITLEMVGFGRSMECAGINRREVANARVVQVRRSEPTWPRVMRGQSQGCT